MTSKSVIKRHFKGIHAFNVLPDPFPA